LTGSSQQPMLEIETVLPLNQIGRNDRMPEECKLYQCQMVSCGYIYNAEKGCKKK